MKMKPNLLRLVLAALAAIVTSSALAFDVSEASLNQLLAAKLAEKRFADLRLTSPHLTLLEGHARFCADARPRIYPRDLSFCAQLTPQWRQESASLFASRMSLETLNVAGVDAQQIDIFRLLMNQAVLPALEGVELYRADNAIAKQVTAVRVLPGRLELDLW
jgi:hypothetical protein